MCDKDYKMTKKELLNMIETRLRLVAFVYSQNSTPLAREATVKNCLNEIEQALEELENKETAQDDKDKELPKQTKSKKTA